MELPGVIFESSGTTLKIIGNVTSTNTGGVFDGRVSVAATIQPVLSDRYESAITYHELLSIRDAIDKWVALAESVCTPSKEVL